MVEEAFASIPERFRKRVQNVAFLVQERPSRKNILGLYHGIPRTIRQHYGVGGQLPDTITIYQEPIERISDGTHESINEIVQKTVWHEVAHHFGMEEEMVREWEKRMERKN